MLVVDVSIQTSNARKCSKVVSDPLHNLQGQEKQMFDQFTLASAGMNLDAVMGAAANVIMNAIRQSYGTKSEAERKFDELFGRTKQQLLHNHYDSVTGRRRSVFPFTQVIGVPFHVDDDADPSKGNGR